jgi:glutamate-1-semialdehyde aminotransferase
LDEFTYPGADGHRTIKRLLSWVGGQAGLLFGGGPFPPEIQEAIVNNVGQLVHGSYGHKSEHELADVLGDVLDGVFSSNNLSCRFGLNGKDGLTAAARIARAATGRKYISTEGSYHGASAEFIHPPFPQGIPDEYKSANLYFKWGDVETVRECAKVSAAICVNAPALAMEEEVRSFLTECRDACDKYGAVFIMDEVVSGFRFSLKGASGWYGVKPDIATYGKCMSALGGIGAVVGRSDLVDLLDGKVFFSLTFGGNPPDCNTAVATIKWLSENEDLVYGKNGHLYKIGNALKDGYNSLGVECVGHPSCSVFNFETNQQWISFCSEMIGRGVIVHRPNFPSMSHTDEDVELTIETARRVLENGI